MSYTLTAGSSVIFNGVIVPADPMNADWQVYQVWLAAGNTPAPALTPTPDAGMSIVSTSTPALNGSYPIDTTTQQKVAAVSLYIQVNGRFPAAQSVLPVFDVSENVHVFTSLALFQAYATALGDFVALIDLGQTPTQPVTII